MTNKFDFTTLAQIAEFLELLNDLYIPIPDKMVLSREAYDLLKSTVLPIERTDESTNFGYSLNNSGHIFIDFHSRYGTVRIMPQQVCVGPFQKE